LSKLTPSLWFLWFAVALATACGGGGKHVSTARSPGGPGDDPATPFDDAALKATLRRVPGSAACGVDPASTLGARLDAEMAAVRGAGQLVEQSFRCRARPDDRWDCEWSVSGKPAGTAPADPCGADPCGADPGGAEPCGDEPAVEDPGAGEPAGFTITATVGPDGSVDPKNVHCVVP